MTRLLQGYGAAGEIQMSHLRQSPLVAAATYDVSKGFGEAGECRMTKK
jgi:hypothetical protein